VLFFNTRAHEKHHRLNVGASPGRRPRGPDRPAEGRGPVFPRGPAAEGRPQPPDQEQSHAAGGPLHGGDGQL